MAKELRTFSQHIIALHQPGFNNLIGLTSGERTPPSIPLHPRPHAHNYFTNTNSLSINYFTPHNHLHNIKSYISSFLIFHFSFFISNSQLFTNSLSLKKLRNLTLLILNFSFFIFNFSFLNNSLFLNLFNPINRVHHIKSYIFSFLIFNFSLPNNSLSLNKLHNFSFLIFN